MKARKRKNAPKRRKARHLLTWDRTRGKHTFWCYAAMASLRFNMRSIHLDALGRKARPLRGLGQ